MSGTEELIAQPPRERRERRERPEGQTRKLVDDAPLITLMDDGAAADAVVNAADVVKERDAALAQERAARQAAEASAAEARRVAAVHAAGRRDERTMAIAAAVEAAKSDQERAKAAMRTAREAGDVEAEAQAIVELQNSSFRFSQASAELAQIQSGQSAPAARANANQQPAISPAAQAWIDAHPRFNTDPAYQHEMLAHHHRLARDSGEGSPAYWRGLDAAHAAIEAREGPSHTEKPADRDSEPMAYSATSTAAPSSRGSGSSNSSSRIETLLGEVYVSRNSDGRIGIRIPPHLREVFEEGAAICKMPLHEYAYEQVKIAQERQAGGHGGLITSEGNRYK